MAKLKRPPHVKGSSTDNSPYDVLAERIVMGDYAPGASLSEQKIADDLGVSRTPVREALIRLRIEGLVRIVPRGGIFVAEATLRRAREVTSLRMVLEEYLAHLVVERRTDPWLCKFGDWLGCSRRDWESLSPRDWMRKDAEFHHLMDEAARNEVLACHLGLLRRQAVLFWGQTTDGQASLYPIIRDFEEVFQAVKLSDTLKCVQVLHRHVLAHVERVQAYLKPEAHRMISSKTFDRFENFPGESHAKTRPSD